MIGLLPLLLLAADAPALDCENAMTQADMNQCAHQDYQIADVALNEQWAEAAAVMKIRDDNYESVSDDRPGFFETLLRAQRLWIAYRDAHCTGEGYYARGGSLEPLLVSKCKTKLTIQRTRYLSFLIEQ